MKITKMSAVAAVVIAIMTAGSSVQANNLTLTNITVKGRDSRTALIKFDISWENSWRHGVKGDPLYFHDAAWVFFKVRPESQTD